MQKRTLVQAFLDSLKVNGSRKAVMYYDSQKGNFIGETYSQLYEKILKLSAFLKKWGLSKGEKVAIFSDNNFLWPVVDFSILGLGAINVSKGSDSKVEETSFIVDFCDIRVLFLENKSMVSYFLSNEEKYPKIEYGIVMNDEGIDENFFKSSTKKFIKLSEILSKNEFCVTPEEKKVLEEVFISGTGDDIATIIFTSGTTGEPKGAMISHYNIVWQFENHESYVDIKDGSKTLCVLPIWHSFQRLVHYCFLLGGGTLVYSRPIPAVMLRDIGLTNPDIIACVPRLLTAIQEGVYKNLKKASFLARFLFKFFYALSSWNVSCERRMKNKIPEFTHYNLYSLRLLASFGYILTFPFFLIGRKIIFKAVRKRLGNNFKAFLSGGGKLPKNTAKFFSVIGLRVQDCYGLTETAPGIAMCKKDSLPGTVGSPFAGKTEVEIRNEEGLILSQGEKGILFVRGPQVMKGGYYKRPDLTSQVISEDGWFNTGDLARVSRQGDIEIVGRAKDTIVLLNGKNIEPLPIEDAIRESEYIEQTVVLGQDKKFLGALIVISQEAIERLVNSFSTGSLLSKATGFFKSQEKDSQHPQKLGCLRSLSNKAHDFIHTPEQDMASLKDVPQDKWWNSREVHELIKSEIQRLVSIKNGFKPYELINNFAILKDSFEVGKELSPKLEVKRHVVNELYKKEITSIFAS